MGSLNSILRNRSLQTYKSWDGDVHDFTSYTKLWNVTFIVYSKIIYIFIWFHVKFWLILYIWCTVTKYWISTKIWQIFAHSTEHIKDTNSNIPQLLYIFFSSDMIFESPRFVIYTPQKRYSVQYLWYSLKLFLQFFSTSVQILPQLYYLFLISWNFELYDQVSTRVNSTKFGPCQSQENIWRIWFCMVVSYNFGSIP